MHHLTMLNEVDFMRGIDQSYVGILLSDLEGRIFYANERVSEISGAPLHEIVGKTPKEMEEAGIIIKQSMEVLQKNPLTIFQKLHNDAKVFITSKPVYRSNGEIQCFIANYYDLSSLNHLYTEHMRNMEMNYTELKQLRSQFLHTDDWIGESQSTKQLQDLVTKVANTDAVITIIGESGVGKEIIAKNIHKQSNRHHAAYIQINCGAIPENLIESELFGYEKGAFTGAQSSHEGLLEAANGGTLLLDEIGEMPLHLQVKLLRVLQTNEVTRVGGTKPRKLDVRFIAATNKNLDDLVQAGQFRVDLYYRLQVIPISIPPLRERKKDIRPLVDYFLAKYNRKYHKENVVTDDVIEAFYHYSWPGNIRQLENLLEHLVILTERPEIDVDSLPSEIRQNLEPSTLAGPIHSLKHVKEQAEKEHIQKVLRHSPSIREAAKVLRVDHSTLVRKIQRYEL
ncbi:sigma-54-dependent Fis family transcriptional regulator [Geomicrobium sp. JCM 19038]|uniref:sigma-54 interaction domain-containing protein n=1 Tax=Geomicrobium sp. JCM 19038 TaxID=1460635 RepID=UPI00045F26F1|nr:sigma 54-interacting transcriptional regulator [Geomicrobium sp. JCM 19038]GAK08208.1 two component, sigma54 specific, transcriptional regulator, Fis family [Geomicrobium sp. JCM 19038]